jgi:hypothetical protein
MYWTVRSKDSLESLLHNALERLHSLNQQRAFN